MLKKVYLISNKIVVNYVKYNKQIFKGLIRILKYGHLPFAFKNLFLELKKLNEN